MLLPALAVSSLLGGVDPIDFAKVPRALVKEPAYVAAPRYGLFLFGEKADVRVWAVLDKNDASEKHYDVLYLDRDADGVLGEEGERIAGEAGKTEGSIVFEVGDFAQPMSEAVHEDWRITNSEASIRFKMKWRGEEVTMGCYGPTRDTYAHFASSSKAAPIFVPGTDRPFEFEHWMSGTLKRGEASAFKVFMGNRGSRTGTFACVDQDFLPKDEYVLATLLYTSESGRELRVQTKLRERC